MIFIMRTSFQFFVFAWVTSFVGFSFQAKADDLTFTSYHTQPQIAQFLRSEAQKYPSLVTFKVLGSSRQKREIAYVTVSNKALGSVPALYFNGTHHGDEWSATEGILGLIDYLVTHRADPQVAGLLDHYAFYLQPLVNPDGHIAKTREDSQGNDPNRDYSFPDQSDADSFKLPEIQLVKSLVDQIKPKAAAAYHSGIEEVLWSWCYESAGAPDKALLSNMGAITAKAMGFDRYLQSYDDYATEGEFIDYAYMKYGTVALTFEVSVIKTPPASQLAGIVKNSITGALAFVNAISKVDSGEFHLNAELKGHLGKMGKRKGPRLE
jgi:hypothetical protein